MSRNSILDFVLKPTGFLLSCTRHGLTMASRLQLPSFLFTVSRVGGDPVCDRPAWTGPGPGLDKRRVEGEWTSFYGSPLCRHVTTTCRRRLTVTLRQVITQSRTVWAVCAAQKEQ